jgi:hypothetical protein
MKIAPNFEVKSFEKLEAGDLFIYDFEGGASAGLKVSDPHHDGHVGALLLGPNFPNGQVGPHLSVAPEKAVVCFGKDFTIQLPIAPAFWAINETAPSDGWMVIDDMKCIYFRVPYGEQGDCFVDANTGKITTGPSSDVCAYPKSWKIAIAIDGGEAHVLVQHS